MGRRLFVATEITLDDESGTTLGAVLLTGSLRSTDMTLPLERGPTRVTVLLINIDVGTTDGTFSRNMDWFDR